MPDALPPRVTGLAPDPRRPGTVRLQLDGEPAGAAPADRVAALGIEEGADLSPEQASALRQLVDGEASFRAALALLGNRPYAEADLARRLIRRGHPREAVDAALARAAAMGLLDDARFARDFVETRSTRGRGPARLRRDLAAMGVSRTDADAAIAAQWPEGQVDPAATLALATRRAAQLAHLPLPVRRRRLLAYLGRRGYGGREAIAAVEAALTHEAHGTG